jgi:hypothetical protein
MAPGPVGNWEVELTSEAAQWFMRLGDREAKKIMLALDQLEESGPATRRSRADSIKGSRHHNMKELRSVGGHFRALFVFDPRRHAIVLVGGDKANDWNGWYRRNIKSADKLYDRHLRSLGKGGPWTTRYQDLRAGRQSAVSER